MNCKCLPEATYSILGFPWPYLAPPKNIGWFIGFLLFPGWFGGNAQVDFGRLQRQLSVTQLVQEGHHKPFILGKTVKNYGIYSKKNDGRPWDFWLRGWSGEQDLQKRWNLVLSGHGWIVAANHFLATSHGDAQKWWYMVIQWYPKPPMSCAEIDQFRLWSIWQWPTYESRWLPEKQRDFTARLTDWTLSKMPISVDDIHNSCALFSLRFFFCCESSILRG